MAIALTGTGGLFTRLGKVGNIINVVNTFRGTTIVADVDELEDQYNNDRDLSQTVQPGLTGHQSGMSAMLSIVQSVGRQTVIDMVSDDNPQEDRGLSTALTELKTQMESSGDDIDYNITSASSVAGGSNNGDGVVVLSTKNGDGLVKQHVVAEDILITCTADSQSGGATAGNESFSVNGQVNTVDRLHWNYPQGSSASTTITGILASGDNATGNKLTNSDFETFTVTNTPDNWTIDVGSAGTEILEEATTIFEGSKALEIVGDGSTLTGISQIFDDSTNGTAGTLSPNTLYSICLWMKVDVVPGAGVLTVDLYDGSSIINDDAGTANSFTVTLSSVTTSYVAYTGVFITPRLLPSTIRLRVRLSTALSTGSSLFIDHVSMGTMTELYAGGPSANVHTGTTIFLVDDFFTITAANDNASDWATMLQRLFDMRTLGIQLPYDTGAAETIADSLLT